jgi:hypothetical protein
VAQSRDSVAKEKKKVDALHERKEGNLAEAKRDLAEAKRDLAEAKRDLSKAERDLAKLMKENFENLSAQAGLVNEAQNKKRASLESELQEKQQDLAFARTNLATAQAILTTAQEVLKKHEEAIWGTREPSL